MKDWLHTGTITCPDCNGIFEARAFEPPQRRLHVVPVSAALTPEGASACANHPRNAATTNCQRCGVFICALCDMNLGSGSFCPSCFDRVRNEGSLQEAKTRYRDYGMMARNTIVAGVLFIAFGALFGTMGLIYARKAIKQRREDGRSVTGMQVATAFAIVEMLAGTAFIVFVIIGIAGGFK
jgi:hypothetical protein